MQAGFWGKILRVDLTNREITVDEHDQNFYRTYMGGRGIVAYYLLKEVPRGCDPLGPENVLIFAASVLTGTSIPGAGRNSAGAKSPLTGGYGEGEGGGDWGVKLRWAGYDGIVFTGRSEKPVYLWVTNSEVVLRDASELWGLEAYETQEAIRENEGDPNVSVAMIGPAGEQLVRFACIAQGPHDYIGRAGIGAVMGSKKLKAIAVKGDLRLKVTDKKGLAKVSRWLGENWQKFLGPMSENGTLNGLAIFNAAGGLPSRNFRDGVFEAFESISGTYMTENILVDRKSCYLCPVHCKRVVEINEKDIRVGTKYSGPEFETVGSFGSNCGIGDLKIVSLANEICNRYTLDTITAGMMISGAMECAEKGLLPDSLTDGLDLRFGSGKGVLDLLNLIVNRQGLGDILAEGPKGIEEKLGKDAASCFLHIKGQPLPIHEPRWKTGLGLGYALAPTGAEHMANMFDPMYASTEAPTFAFARNMGILEAVDPFELNPSKVRLWVHMMLNKSLYNNLCVCAFFPYTLTHLADLVRGVTGWDVSGWELIKVSERALNMARAFNTLEGFGVNDDSLPERIFEPIENGPLKGQAIERHQFAEMRNLAYDMLGWDHQLASPRRWKLHELGLHWLTEKMEKHGCLQD
jgi:aldehyde:ferredoxin oxidoreductase